MPLIRQKFITRKDVRENFPNTIYLFGDNMQRSGFGGQAAEMRGEPNALGVPTKWSPHMGNNAFFSDGDWEKVIDYITFPFSICGAWIQRGKNVVIPTDGLGTGLSELPTRAPYLAEKIDFEIAFLQTLSDHLSTNPTNKETV
jgi:hypothetical protein